MAMGKGMPEKSTAEQVARAVTRLLNDQGAMNGVQRDFTVPDLYRKDPANLAGQDKRKHVGMENFPFKLKQDGIPLVTLLRFFRHQVERGR